MKFGKRSTKTHGKPTSWARHAPILSVRHLPTSCILQSELLIAELAAVPASRLFVVLTECFSCLQGAVLLQSGAFPPWGNQQSTCVAVPQSLHLLLHGKHGPLPCNVVHHAEQPSLCPVLQPIYCELFQPQASALQRHEPMWVSIVSNIASLFSKQSTALALSFSGIRVINV